MRNRFLIVFLGVLILAAGYKVYRWSTKSLAAWEFIPTTATLILSSSQLQDSTLYTHDGRINIKELPIIQFAVGNLSIFNWFNSDTKQVQTFLKDKHITFSFHPKGTNEFGVIMYVPLSNDLEKQWLENPKIAETRTTQHTFEDQSVNDVTTIRSKPLFSYIIKGDYLIISQYGELIEDVLRKPKNQDFNNSLQDEFEEFSEAKSPVNIYTKSQTWDYLLPQKNLPKNVSEFFKILPSLQNYHFTNDSSEYSLGLQSLSIEGPESAYTEWFDGTQSTPFIRHEYISQQTSVWIRAAADDANEFKDNYQSWVSSQRNTPAMQRISALFGKNKSVLIDHIGPEIILCLNEKRNNLHDSKIALVQFENYEKLMPILKEISVKTKTDISNFQGYEIFPFPEKELPAALFGPIFSGFNRSYITYVEPYLVIGNNSQAIRNYLVDFDNQLTWKQSPLYDGVHVKGNAHLVMLTNMRKSGISNSGVNAISSVENITFNVDFDDTDITSLIGLRGMPLPFRDTLLNHTKLEIEIEWPDTNGNVQLSPLQLDDKKTVALLLTDKEFNLYEFTTLTTGKPRILAKLDGPIVGRVYQADFLNIGRLQKTFCTANQIYLIDEDSDGIVTLLSDRIPSTSPIVAMHRVNGGAESSTRFLIQDASDNLFLWERVHKPSIRLNKSIIHEKIITPVTSFQQGNKDFFCLTAVSGNVYLVDDKGNIQKGFPIDKLTKLTSSFTWTQNNNASEIELIGTTSLGELSHIDLKGNVTSSKQLLRPQSSISFRTLFDVNNLDWLLLSDAGGRATLLDKDAKSLFEVENLLKNATIKYHYFGSDNRFIAIQSGNFTTIFNIFGKMVGNQPFQSNTPVGVTYQSSQSALWIFTRNQKSIQIWSIKVK